jgi:molybdate transport system substrate-binding protein
MKTRFAECAAVLFIALFAQPARAGDGSLEVVCSHAFLSAIEDLAPEFERSSGYKLQISFGTSGEIVKRFSGDKIPDVAILTKAALQGLVKSGNIAPESPVDIASTGVGIGVRDGSALPDVSSTETLKRALLSSASIAYSDPASGGASGIHFSEVVKRLGLAEELRAKTKLVPNGGNVGEVVASGGADLGIQMNSELIPIKGLRFVGSLPPDANSVTMFSAGVTTKSGHPDAAKQLIQYLSSPAVAPVMHAKGLQPAG